MPQNLGTRSCAVCEIGAWRRDAARDVERARCRLPFAFQITCVIACFCLEGIRHTNTRTIKTHTHHAHAHTKTRAWKINLAGRASNLCVYTVCHRPGHSRPGLLFLGWSRGAHWLGRSGGSATRAGPGECGPVRRRGGAPARDALLLLLLVGHCFGYG